MEDLKARAAEHWFGYGRWGAPYWFVGKEPGDIDDPENYASWARLGGHDLIDCRDHDLEYRGKDRGVWHIGRDGSGPRLQPTWRPLIAMLLAYRGSSEYDREAIRAYQADCWGRVYGETCVVELSAAAARSTATPESRRLDHVEERIEVLKRKIALNSPEFVIFYGTGIAPGLDEPYATFWRRIAEAPLEESRPRLVGETAYCFTRHPSSRGLRNGYWTGLGREIARIRSRR